MDARRLSEEEKEIIGLLASIPRCRVHRQERVARKRLQLHHQTNYARIPSISQPTQITFPISPKTMPLDMSLKNGLPLFRGEGKGRGVEIGLRLLFRNKGQKEDRVQNETHTTSLLKTEMRLSCVLKSYRFFQGNKWRKAAMSGPLRNKSITVI